MVDRLLIPGNVFKHVGVGQKHANQGRLINQLAPTCFENGRLINLPTPICFGAIDDVTEDGTCDFIDSVSVEGDSAVELDDADLDDLADNYFEDVDDVEEK